MRVWARSLTPIVLIAFTGATNADWYSCKDPSYGGDSPPRECRGETCVTKSNGARTCTRPPETAEERKKRENAEKRQKECEKKALDKRRDDNRFLDKYKTEDDIQKERYRAIVEQQRHIDAAKQRLEEGETKQAKLAEETRFYEQHPIPENLRRDIESNRQMLDVQERDLVSARNGMQQINDKYDAILKRHKDLILNGTQTVPCNSFWEREPGADDS